jgi:hypothetical protein
VPTAAQVHGAAQETSSSVAVDAAAGWTQVSAASAAMSRGVPRTFTTRNLFETARF